MKHLLLASLITSTIAFASENNTSNTISVKQEGIKYIKMLGGALKKELQTQMMADTTGLKALEFCTAKANAITQEVNKKLPSYATVRRTALKLRNNIHNKADVLDEKIMQEYTLSLKAKTFKPTDIKIVEEGNVNRVYKPLITMPVCLKCHGTEVTSELKEHIKTAYPKDKAMDFKVGTLRGVIVAEIEKH